jgi:hypothetical protein
MHNPSVLQCLQKGIRAFHATCVSIVYILLHDFKTLFKTVVPNCSIIYDPWTDSITSNANFFRLSVCKYIDSIYKQGEVSNKSYREE